MARSFYILARFRNGKPLILNSSQNRRTRLIVSSARSDINNKLNSLVKMAVPIECNSSEPPAPYEIIIVNLLSNRGISPSTDIPLHSLIPTVGGSINTE